MLLLLESAGVYGDAYKTTIRSILEAYFRDYEDHAANFRPIFLVNDIIRFWKTLCLNYEHRRNQKDEARKIKQKIRNFKLGYSRLMTCFATVALLSSYNNITREELEPICQIPPIDRLMLLAQKRPDAIASVKNALMLYHWFLERTAVSTKDLESYFANKDNRRVAFENAKKFGDEMYRIVQQTAESTGTLRYLVV